GSPMPISGTAQQLWAFDPNRWRWLGWALTVTGLPWLFAGTYEGPGVDVARAMIIISGAFMLWTAWRSGPKVAYAGSEAEGKARRSHRFAKALAAALIALALWYALSSFAYWFYSRYLMPAALIGVVGVSILAARPVARWPLAGALGVLAVGLPVLYFAVT